MRPFYALLLSLLVISALLSAATSDGVSDTSSSTVVPQDLPNLDTELSKSNYLSSWHCQRDVAVVATPFNPTITTAPNIKYDVDSLNSHFKVKPADITKSQVDAIHDVEKNTGTDKLLDPYFRAPLGVRGSHGKAHQSGVWLLDLDATPFLLEEYNAAHLYQKPDIPESWTKYGAYSHALVFIVSLMDLPKIGTTIFDKDRLANTSAVTVEKFILTDDKGNSIQPFEGAGITDQGLKTDYDTFYSLGNRDRFAYLPYYSERYIVVFPLFDIATGRALVKVDCKKITLHLITQSGEQAVEYELK